MNPVHLNPIAIVHSPFKEKFVTPRQPGLIPSATARIEFLPDYAIAETVCELGRFSHIWLIFLFHEQHGENWHPTVRPPRLGGNQRVGVFASRSPFRPNPIGLSAVRLVRVEAAAGEVWLEVAGADLVDGTPIIDIKPYIPYADSIPTAHGGFADQAPQQRLQVRFSPVAYAQLQQFTRHTAKLETLIRETLGLDPRPAYRQRSDDPRIYGCRLEGYNIRWRVENETLLVTDMTLSPKKTPAEKPPAGGE